jgi:hypothetical protein
VGLASAVSDNILGPYGGYDRPHPQIPDPSNEDNARLIARQANGDGSQTIITSACLWLQAVDWAEAPRRRVRLARPFLLAARSYVSVHRGVSPRRAAHALVISDGAAIASLE